MHHMYMFMYTNVRLRAETRDRLKLRGAKGDSYDDIVVKLLDDSEKDVKR
jgi:hypothetical protein